MEHSDRLLTGVIFGGAVFAMIGNALHPFFQMGISAEEFLAGVTEASSVWAFVHLSLVLAVTLIAVGVVMVSQRLDSTPGGELGRLTVVIATVGAALYVLWQGVLDGVVFPALAEDLAGASDGAALLAAATAMLAVDEGLAAMSVLAFNGVAVLTFGLAMHRAEVFAPAIRWTFIVAGASGTLVGAMMFLGIAQSATFWLFRLAGLVETLALFGLAAQLYRGTSGLTRTTDAPADTRASVPGLATS